MCLSIAIKRPNDILATGEHCGLKFHVIHNGNGYRCGYVRVPNGHPWHGKDYGEIDAEVHGGLTFGEADVPCGAGEDSDHWFGFDCAHAWDDQDMALPGCHHASKFPLVPIYFHDGTQIGGGSEVRDQEFVEAECRSLCEQAAAAMSA